MVVVNETDEVLVLLIFLEPLIRGGKSRALGTSFAGTAFATILGAYGIFVPMATLATCRAVCGSLCVLN